MLELVRPQQSFIGWMGRPLFFGRSSSLVEEEFPKIQQQSLDVKARQESLLLEKGSERQRRLEQRSNLEQLSYEGKGLEKEGYTDLPVPLPKRTIEARANFVIIGRGEMPPLDDDFVYFDE